MKKRLISVFVLFILVSSIFALAEDTAVTLPSFWEKVSLWLFGTSKQDTALVARQEGFGAMKILRE